MEERQKFKPQINIYALREMFKQTFKLSMSAKDSGKAHFAPEKPKGETKAHINVEAFSENFKCLFKLSRNLFIL